MGGLRVESSRKLAKMTKNKTVKFDLRLTQAEYLSYYKGDVHWVQVRAHDGRRIRFPASALRPFVTAEGVDGSFEITYDDSRRLVEIRRLGD